MMLYLKACPRCSGDVKYERDVYGRYLECLQCGFLLSSKSEGTTASSEKSTGGKAARGTVKAA